MGLEGSQGFREPAPGKPLLVIYGSLAWAASRCGRRIGWTSAESQGRTTLKLVEENGCVPEPIRLLAGRHR